MGDRVERVWNEGKAPRYWMPSWIILLAMMALWFANWYFLGWSASPIADRLHPTGLMSASGRIVYYPKPLVWFRYSGLFICCAGMLLLGLIAAVKRSPKAWR